MIKSLYNFLIITALLSIVFSCNEEKKENSQLDYMSVSGSIKGLRKGVLFLQKVNDGKIENIDSININGNPEFLFKYPLESPEIFYLYLKKEDGDSLNDRILFFGEKGGIEINSLLRTFESSAQIKGSDNQFLLQEYNSIKRKFNNENLNLLREYYNLKIKKNFKKADSIEKKIENLIKRRYLYALNFASNNADKEVSAYIALTEVNDANLKLLDTLVSRMNVKTLSSKYGKQFVKYLASRHKNEEKN
jgi:hypothetical protein